MASRSFLTLDCRIIRASTPCQLTSPHVLKVEVADDSPLLQAPLFSLTGRKYDISGYTMQPFRHETPGIETIDCPITISDARIMFYSDSDLK